MSASEMDDLLDEIGSGLGCTPYLDGGAIGRAEAALSKLRAALSGSSAPQAPDSEDLLKALRAELVAAKEAIVVRDQNDNGLFMEAWKQKTRADAAEAALREIDCCEEHVCRLCDERINAVFRPHAALSMKSEGPATPEGGSQKGSGK